MESAETRLVWITILAMKDENGNVLCAPSALAHIARVDKESCDQALQIFLSPDPESTSKVCEGRRIEEIPGGWHVINHEKYRYSDDARRAFWRDQKRKQRAREAMQAGKQVSEKREEKIEKDRELDEEMKHMMMFGAPPEKEGIKAGDLPFGGDGDKF